MLTVAFSFSALIWMSQSAIAQAPTHPLLGPLAIQELEGVVAWRDLRVGRRALNTLLSHAPKLSRFEEAASRVKEIKWGTFEPFTGGMVALDPKRGLALMWSERGALRLLINHRRGRAVEALNSVQAFLSEGLGLRWRLHLEAHGALPFTQAALAEALDGSDKALTCRRDRDRLICDTADVLSAPAPYWLTADLDRGAIWSYVHTPRMLPRPFLLPWESVEAHVDLLGDELNLSVNLGAGFNTLLNLFSPREGLSPLTQWVHDDAPVAIKLSFDPEVFLRASVLAMQLPWLRSARNWVEAGWNGEVLLTFDGGLDHPVLLFGLQDHPWSGEKLSETLAESLSFRVISSRGGEDSSDESLRWWGVDHHEGEPWGIPTLSYGGALMVALFPADLKRRLRSDFKESRSPRVFTMERLGVSGGIIDPAIFELNELNGGRISLGTLSAALLRLWKEGGEGLIDVPAPLYGEEGSLAEALSRLSRYEAELLVKLFTPMTQDQSLFIALTDLSSLILQLTDMLELNAHSYSQEESGGLGLSLELTWSIL